MASTVDVAIGVDVSVWVGRGFGVEVCVRVAVAVDVSFWVGMRLAVAVGVLVVNTVELAAGVDIRVGVEVVAGMVESRLQAINNCGDNPALFSRV